MKITAPFYVNHKWVWITWRATAENTGNKHFQMIEKAKEIGATAWDYGQARCEIL